jgi:nitrous oxidase accessory protein NosD
MARSRRYLVVMLAALILGFAWAGAAQARAHGATVVGPGDSIQAAVDGAASGDTIVVFGRHRENVAIVKDGLTLRGIGAVLVPPFTPAAHACFDPTQEGEAVHGICVSGDVDLDTGEVSRYVEDVTVSGFTIRDFTGSGINLTAARDATITGNVAVHNIESGIAASAAPGTRMLFNRASGTDRAAFFVFRSPAVSLIGNVAEDSRYGIQIGDTVHGRLLANSVHDNCVGVLLIADAPGPVGEFRIAGNRIQTNTRACPSNDDSPALSGAGLVLFGARGNTIVNNLITGNRPAGESLVSGGVAVIAGPGGTAPTDNVVQRNTIRGNDPDIFWDQTGNGNVLLPNRCRTSNPPSLCR